MKALLINGSPHRRGCTYTALGAVETGLQEQGIDADIMWIGTGAISGCLGCGKCLKSGRCFIDDAVNQFLEDVPKYDAFVFGSPVHFAGASGALTSFMDRAFYGRGGLFAGKPAAAIASCRRGGASAAFDQLNKYFTMSNMLVVGSQYWNQVHGSTPEEVMKDEEGMQTMRTLGRNMAWNHEVHRGGQGRGHRASGPRARDSHELHSLVGVA